MQFYVYGLALASAFPMCRLTTKYDSRVHTTSNDIAVECIVVLISNVRMHIREYTMIFV